MKKKLFGFDGALLAALVCCLLGSAAFCSALLPALGQEVSLTDCLLLAAVDLSLIFLLSRRWWIAPALIVALAAAGAAAVRFFHLWDPLVEYVEGFLAWYRAAYPYTLPYSENGSRFLVHLAFSFPVTLLLFIYFRRLPFLPLWILLSGALVGWMYYSGADNRLSVAALLLIVAFVLIARANAGSIGRKLGIEGRLPAASMQITALVLAPFVVLFAVVIGPKEDGAWRSKALVNFVEDVNDMFSFYGEGSSAGSGSFDLGYSGLAPNGWILGGDIAPNNKTVLRVKTDTPILLAGAVYDGYDGRGWFDPWAQGNFRFSSPLWRGRRREVFTIDKPSSKKAAALYAKLSRTAILEVSMAVKFRSFFSDGKLELLDLPYGDNADVYFNNQGELYLQEFPIIYTKYTVQTRVFARDREDFDDNMRLLLRAAAGDKDKEYEEIARRCTVVSDTVEPFVLALAEEITAGCPTDYDKALAIETWLGENCSYTKTPGDVPEGRDFVSYFLETREGYCTYYASAMALLARAAGLPARYVTGYGLKQGDRRPHTTNYAATNATAHAWAQVYFYGVGWVYFDPMKWDFYEPAEADAPFPRETQPVIPTPSPLPTPEPETPEPEDKEEETPEETETSLWGDGSGRILLLVLAADVGALLLFLLIRFILLFFRVEYFQRRLYRRYPDNAARADACYRQYIRQLGFLGLEMQPADTISSFCEKADALLDLEPGRVSMTKACECVLLNRFARRKPRDTEIRRMCDFYIDLERRLRRAMGLRRYVLRRMLLGR